MQFTRQLSACSLTVICMYISSNHAVHQRAIGVLCNLLYNHDLDVRYTDPQIKVRPTHTCIEV